MPTHSAASGTELHDPKGVSPTPLLLPDNTGSAYLIRVGASEIWVKLDTTTGSEKSTYGDATLKQQHQFNGPVLLADGVEFNGTSVTSTPHTMTSGSDSILKVKVTTIGAAATVNLPEASTVSSRLVIVSDVERNCSTYNITIDGYTAETIGGSATLVMSTDGQAVMLWCDGSEWHILSNSAGGGGGASANDNLSESLLTEIFAT